MFSLFLKGGPVMWVILLVSIYGLGIFIERMYYFYSIRIDSKLLLVDIKNLLRRGELELAKDTTRRISGPLPEILKSGLKRINGGKEEIREAMERAGDIQMRNVEGNSKHLALIANISPLLGLLGTVTGMIIAFNSISMKGLGNPNIVANGISAALLTTAYGLIVALPAIIAYNIVDNKIESVRYECEEYMNDFLSSIDEMEKDAIWELD